MRVKTDTCTLILLAKASVLEAFSHTSTVEITADVKKEVLAGKTKMFADALLVERLLSEKKIKETPADSLLTKKISNDFNMGKGEASTIVAALKDKGGLVATDNKQGRKAALVNDLKLVGSIEIIVSLYKKQKITREKAEAALKTLKKEGWFHTSLVERAEEDLNE